MADLLAILSTLFEFFAFVLLATAAVCVPVAGFLWAYELIHQAKGGLRRPRRRVIQLTKIA